jgi:hypothetical protein
MPFFQKREGGTFILSVIIHLGEDNSLITMEVVHSKQLSPLGGNP